jgi:hypothetical protein
MGAWLEEKFGEDNLGIIIYVFIQTWGTDIQMRFRWLERMETFKVLSVRLKFML